LGGDRNRAPGGARGTRGGYERLPMETDLVWMTLLVFLPTLFALGLIFFPRGWNAAMCWWSLAGTAATLGRSIGVFVLYKSNVVAFGRAGSLSERENRSAMSLESRTARMDAAAAAGGTEQFSGTDWVSRYPWIKRFNIDYFLGIDGISLPLVLLTTFLSFL